jgi:hypothetical protein
MLGLRWTIGDVSQRGFAALRLSLWGAWKIFGDAASYRVLVNSIELSQARELTGPVPRTVRWELADSQLPTWLRELFLDAGMAEGVAWKFAPLRCFPAAHELAFDNDVVLWRMPPAIAAWLDDDNPNRCLLAEDVVPSFGQFADLCGPAPRNLGIRGLPPGFDLERALQAVLTEHPVQLRSELDEQGLQVAAVSREVAPRVVCVEDVTICSPFPPHLPHLGRCGAHFVGLNARHFGWNYYDEPAERVRARHYDELASELHARTGAPLHQS